jgi:hypothetical protein
MYGWVKGRVVIEFVMHARRIRFDLPLPDRDDPRFSHTTAGRELPPLQAQQAYEQELRRRWRALALAIRAKLEAVETGITEIESEFLANIVLPDQRTVGQIMVPQVELAYRTGRMPPLLPVSELDD